MILFDILISSIHISNLPVGDDHIHTKVAPGVVAYKGYVYGLRLGIIIQINGKNLRLRLIARPTLKALDHPRTHMIVQRVNSCTRFPRPIKSPLVERNPGEIEFNTVALENPVLQLRVVSCRHLPARDVFRRWAARLLAEWPHMHLCRTIKITDERHLGAPEMQQSAPAAHSVHRLVGPRHHLPHRRPRCGRWSRFHRTKASSLVSSKRSCNLGDSTWPSQNSTLALP